MHTTTTNYYPNSDGARSTLNSRASNTPPGGNVWLPQCGDPRSNQMATGASAVFPGL